MNSLQQITDAWGTWFSKAHGTSCKFTASTNYGSQGDLNKYHQYQTNALVQNIVYEGNTPPTGGSIIAYELWYNNDTSLQQQNIFQEVRTSTSTFTWSITQALSIGVEISATEGVQNVASSSQKLTVNLSLSSTLGETITDTQTWQVNSPINVPPNSSVKADMVISTQSYNINFTQTVLLQGSVAIWNNDKIELKPNDWHRLWFIPIESVFQDCINNNIIDTSGYTITAGGVLATAKGVFTGSQGVSVGVTAKQFPLCNSGEKALQAVNNNSSSHLLAIAGKD